MSLISYLKSRSGEGNLHVPQPLLRRRLLRADLPHPATQRREEGRGLLAQALAGRSTASAPEVLRVAVETGDPVGRLFAERWAEEGSAELAEPLAELCESDNYRASVPLRELALATALQVLESRRAAGPPSEIARWTNVVGNRLVALGRPEEAEAFLTETVALRRQFAAADPETFRAVLARSLSNLGLLYLDLGRSSDALRAMEEAVAMQREIAADGQLALLLSNLSLACREMGEREQALAAAREAVDRCFSITWSRHARRRRGGAGGPALAGGIYWRKSMRWFARSVSSYFEIE